MPEKFQSAEEVLVAVTALAENVKCADLSSDAETGIIGSYLPGLFEAAQNHGVSLEEFNQALLGSCQD